MRNHSFRRDDRTFLIPGFEDILFGIDNLNPIELNCCLKYEVKEEDGSYGVYIKYDLEDYYEYEYRYSFNSTIPYSNDELFSRYGFSIENNSKDYLNYTLNDIYIKLSCNDIDLNNVININIA